LTADVPHRAGSTAARFRLLVQEFGRFEFMLRDTVALGSPAAAPDLQVRRALAGIFVAELPLDTNWVSGSHGCSRHTTNRQTGRPGTACRGPDTHRSRRCDEGNGLSAHLCAQRLLGEI
jgi:hypothetical protein